jgi:hypothetical protein
MNEQPSKSLRRNHPSKTSKIASSRSRGSAARRLTSAWSQSCPQLLAALEEGEHQVLLRVEVAVERLPRDARAGDDRVDPHRLDPLAGEEVVGRVEDPLPRAAGSGVAINAGRRHRA